MIGTYTDNTVRMKRFTSILLAVILGSIATGIGTVPFLVLANQDRHRLDTELRTSKSTVAEAEMEKQRIAEEANKKVEEANLEIQRAQQVILEAQSDERLLTEAERLEPPTMYERSKMNQAISLYQGISLFVPNKFTILEDEPNGFSIAKEQNGSTRMTPVLLIEPFDKDHTSPWTGSFASSTPIALVAGGRLLKGEIGTLSDDSFAMRLEVRLSAKTTHVIWITDTEGSIAIYKKILSTIEYR